MPDKVWWSLGSFSIGGDAQIKEEAKGIKYIGAYNKNKKKEGPGILIDSNEKVVSVGMFKNGVFEGDVCDFECNNLGKKPFMFLSPDKMTNN